MLLTERQLLPNFTFIWVIFTFLVFIDYVPINYSEEEGDWVMAVILEAVG